MSTKRETARPAEEPTQLVSSWEAFDAFVAAYETGEWAEWDRWWCERMILTDAAMDYSASASDSATVVTITARYS